MRDGTVNHIAGDVAWLGVDRVGRVAVFTTAGMGPIPTAVAANPQRINRAEEAIHYLRPVGGCELVVRLGRSDDYVSFARRGFFAYDVDAGHGAGFTYRYEVIARPTVPRAIGELDEELAALAELARFDTLSFADTPAIPAHDLLPCVQRRRWATPWSLWAWLWGH